MMQNVAGETAAGLDDEAVTIGTARSGTGSRARTRWRMAARVLTAFLGGYAAAAALATLLARLLPIARVEATAWGMVLSFALYAAILLWAFHEARLWRCAAFIWGTALLAGGALWLLGVRP